MRRFLCIAFMLICGSCLHAAPPEFGGYVTGADSAVCIFWFHAQLHAYEQGFDGDIEELNLVPGDEQGEYSIVQKASFPYMSFITEHLAKIYPGDIFHNLPGDQYSPFGYSVYLDGDDSLPVQPAIIKGCNSLCGEVPCGEEWAVNVIDHSFISGGKLWFGIDWADSTPAAPQVKYAVLADYEVKNMLGVGVDGVYAWSGISQSPIFRNRFLSVFEVDTLIEFGWRRKMIADDRPDSFLVNCYRSQDGVLISSHNVGIDTLCFCLPEAEVDSVNIASYYGDCLDSGALVLRYRRNVAVPVITDVVEGDQYMIPYSFELVVHNPGSEPIDLSIGYDKSLIKGEVDILKMGADETSAIPFEMTIDQSDSTEFMIILSDKSNEYYPHLVRVPYPPQEVTGVDESESGGAAFMFRAFPNPCRDKMMFDCGRTFSAARIEIYNVIGQKVSENNISHASRITWDGRDKDGQRLAAGVYFVKMTGNKGDYYVRRVILLE